MKTFVKYNSQGKILSVSQLEIIPEGLEQPYSELEADENVLEISGAEELQEFDVLQIHSNYQVDVEAKALVKKTE